MHTAIRMKKATNDKQAHIDLKKQQHILKLEDLLMNSNNLHSVRATEKKCFIYLTTTELKISLVGMD